MVHIVMFLELLYAYHAQIIRVVLLELLQFHLAISVARALSIIVLPKHVIRAQLGPLRRGAARRARCAPQERLLILAPPAAVPVHAAIMVKMAYAALAQQEHIIILLLEYRNVQGAQ
jgi:hypothetical protein